MINMVCDKHFYSFIQILIQHIFFLVHTNLTSCKLKIKQVGERKQKKEIRRKLGSLVLKPGKKREARTRSNSEWRIN
jgi:hypothetical protein